MTKVTSLPDNRTSPGDAAVSGLFGGLGAGALMAVSGVDGMLFRLGWRFAQGKPFGRVPGWVAGLAFGILLWILAQAVILPGTDSSLRSIPPGLFAVPHGVYGIALGALAQGKR